MTVMVGHKNISKIILNPSRFHITTPIFYPNAKPHLGHFYSSLLCDVQYRWNKLLKKDTLFTTGTDEHGLKIQLASEVNGFNSPKGFVDKLAPAFIEMDKLSHINFTRFVRTTDGDHDENVKNLWKLCWNNGYIYKGEHKGWYSISDETFYPESKILRITEEGTEVPLDGKIYPESKYINIESRNEVIYQSEVNYFFKLSSFKHQLISFLKENSDFIYPPSKYLQVLRDLQENDVSDLSISRPSVRLKWGIPVPNDDSQTIYVWFDALCNYITSIGGINCLKNKSEQAISLHKDHTVINFPHEWWINTIHVIGKDIIKFHSIYWVAFLLGANLPLPKKIVVHGHWLSHGVKMSKSIGNVINPLEIINYYGADPTRWYVLEHSSLETDNDFSEMSLFNTRELLCSKWGNLINRCGGPKFNIHRAVLNFSRENLTKMENIFSDETLKKQFVDLVSTLNSLQTSFDKKFENFDIAGVIRLLWSIISNANSLIQTGEPWKKTGDERDLLIFAAVETSRVLSILAQPIIPELSHKFLDRIDVDPSKRVIEYAYFGADSFYGKNANNKGRPVPIHRIPVRNLE